MAKVINNRAINYLLYCNFDLKEPLMGQIVLKGRVKIFMKLFNNLPHHTKPTMFNRKFFCLSVTFSFNKILLLTKKVTENTIKLIRDTYCLYETFFYRVSSSRYLNMWNSITYYPPLRTRYIECQPIERNKYK